MSDYLLQFKLNAFINWRRKLASRAHRTRIGTWNKRARQRGL